MSRRLAAGIALALAALLAACTAPRDAGDRVSVATWSGGALSLAEVEETVAESRTPACLALRRSPGGGSPDELLPCYREAARSAALERLVLAGVPDLEPAIARHEVYEPRRRAALLQRHLTRLREGIEVADGEIEAHYERHPERYRRPGQLSLWNIFRRHEEAERPEETIELLREVRRRFLAGETFAALAREVSHSETRLRDGQVGRVVRGQLPRRLETVAFALPEGGVSEPIPVRGGAVLLHVRQVVPEADLSLAEVEGRIRAELGQRRLEEIVVARVAGREPPPGSRVLAPEELAAALDGDPERQVLDLAGLPLAAGEMRRLAGLGDGVAVADLGDDERRRLAEAYRHQVDLRLLLLELLAAPDPDLAAEAEAQARRAAVERLVDERLRDEMLALVDADPERLHRYWQDNRHHYQSPPRFRLELWRLPFADDPPRQLGQMEELREELAAGRLDLAAAAGRLGGTVEELGWLDHEALGERLSDNAVTYLLELGGPGYSVPHRRDEELHLIRVVEREEPRPLELEAARERVREDYLTRFQQELYRRAADARLGAAGFAFDEEAVRRALEPPEAAGSG